MLDLLVEQQPQRRRQRAASAPAAGAFAAARTFVADAQPQAIDGRRLRRRWHARSRRRDRGLDAGRPSPCCAIAATASSTPSRTCARATVRRHWPSATSMTTAPRTCWSAATAVNVLILLGWTRRVAAQQRDFTVGGRAPRRGRRRSERRRAAGHRRRRQRQQPRRRVHLTGRRTFRGAGVLQHGAEPGRDYRRRLQRRRPPGHRGERRSDPTASARAARSPARAARRTVECEPGGICSALGKASVLLQQANGTFGPAHDTDVEEVPTGIAAIDANCDGKDDLVVANLASDTLSVLQACPSAAPCATAPPPDVRAQADGERLLAGAASDRARRGGLRS